MLNLATFAKNRCCASVLGLVWTAIAFTTAPAFGHQKWLWPNRFTVDRPPQWISFDVTWSDRPFVAEEGVNDRPLAVVDPDGRSSPPDRAFVGKTKSTAESELKREGTYRLESIDPLTYWTQIEKDGKSQWLKKSKEEVKGEKVTRADLYWSKALAYVTVGKNTPPASLEADPLAIVPLPHPNEIALGNPISFKVLSHGKTVEGAELKVFDSKASGHEPSATITCDKDGIGKIEFKSEGRYLVVCQVERDVKDDPKADIHSFNVYLTLMVGPERK